MIKLNPYEAMWVMVFFDLPTVTKKQLKAYNKFRNNLEKDGFCRFQLSIYMRSCGSRSNALLHKNRVKGFLPEEGCVSTMTLTDKQFEDIDIFYGKSPAKRPDAGIQLELC